MVLGLAWLQITVIAVEPAELTVSVGAPVIVQVAGELQTVPVLVRVFENPPVARVPVKPVQLMLLTVELAEDHVTVTAPDAASKNTSSDAPGTDDPPAPPEVVDHLEPAELFQVFVPPTQYLFAMRYSCEVSTTGLTTDSQLVRRSCFMASNCSSVKPWSSARFKASQNEPNGVSNLKMICMIAPYTWVVTATTSQRVLVLL